MKKHFRLIGRRNVFITLRVYLYHGIKCVHGITLDGNRETRARVDDVYFLDDPAKADLPAYMYEAA